MHACMYIDTTHIRRELEQRQCGLKQTRRGSPVARRHGRLACLLARAGAREQLRVRLLRRVRHVADGHRELHLHVLRQGHGVRGRRVFGRGRRVVVRG